MSTYSTNLRIELPTDGTQAGTWGNTTNANMAFVLDSSVAGYQEVTVAATPYALTYTNGPSSSGSSNESVYAMLKITSAPSAFVVYAPPNSKSYIIWNATGYAMSLRVSDVIGSTSPKTGNVALSIAANTKVLVWSDATSFYDIQSASLTGVLGVPSGGTGVTTSTGTGSVVLSASPVFTGTPSAPTAAYGTSTAQIATTAFVQALLPSGVIVMWSGSIASIPSGWLLCNGSSGTPDLRDRFIVGAGSSYAVAATGGSANATLVSHTHTASSSSTFTGTALGTHTHGVTDPGHTHTPGFISTSNINSGTSNGGSVQTPAPIPSALTGISVNGASAGTPSGTVSTSTSISTEGSSATNANLPPYYALAYIMKA